MTNNVSLRAPIAHRPLILIACMLAMFMSAIEATIVVVLRHAVIIIGDLGGFLLRCSRSICCRRRSQVLVLMGNESF